MPTKIVVQSGGGATRDYWVRDEVVRIGSDPACDLRVVAPGVEAHAATLEYLAGEYRVHNRSGRSIRLDQSEVAPRAWGLWRDSRILALAPGTSLRLESEADPSPASPARPAFSAPANEPEPLDDPEQATPVVAPDPAAMARRKQQFQVAVIASCAIALPLVIVLAPSPPSAGSLSATFGGFSEAYEREPEAVRESLGDLRRTLNDAQIQERHGDPSRAWLLYCRARDRLVVRRGRDGSWEHPSEQIAYQLALDRIAALPPASSGSR
jgi:hypothetical protein